MRQRIFALAGAFCMILVVTAPGRAQVLWDLKKIDCDQFLGFKVADPKEISIWISGYFHGKRGLTTFEPQRFRNNYDALKTACFTRENLKRPVFEVAEKLFGSSN
jgi:hypothetical protein